MKLSPNLRKLTKEYKATFVSEEDKTAWSCEVRQLKGILDMVKDPDAKVEEGFLKGQEEEEDFM